VVIEPRPIGGQSDPPDAQPERAGWGRGFLRAASLALGIFLLIISSAFLFGTRSTLGETVPTQPVSADGWLHSPPSASTVAVPTPDLKLSNPEKGTPTPIPADRGEPAQQTDKDADHGGSGSGAKTPAPTSSDEGDAAGDRKLAVPQQRDEPVLATPTPTATPLPPTAVPVVPTRPPLATATPQAPTPVPATPTLPPPTATPPPPPPPPPPTPTPTQVPAPPAAPPLSLHPLESGVFDALNAERAAAGVPALALDATLVNIARLRSSDMVARGYFDHVNPDGLTVFDILDQFGVPWAWAGENLALNNYPPDEAAAATVRDLMASPPHRDNNLNSHYSRVGIGLATTSDGVRYFAIVFVGY
jgi:uncharacterized protein YkwD